MVNRTAIARYADAAASLRPRQILWRARRLVPPSLLALGLRPPEPSWRPLAAGVGVESAPQSGPTTLPHSDGVFRAVGHRRAFPGPGFWSDPADGLLFLFALHSFGALAEYAAGETSPEGDSFWTEVTASWLRECGRPTVPAWHPYPLSRRLVAWSSALSAEIWPGEVRHEALTSMTLQARYLRRALEHDVGGNHLLLNAVALTIAGGCLGDEPARRAGEGTLRRELRRQLLPDGGHEERSPAYHRDLLERLIDVREVAVRGGHDVPEGLAEAIDRMERWLDSLAGPDGRLPLLNDAWEGPPLGGSAAGRVTDLADSGYVVFRAGGDQLVADVGRGCPPHLPAHVHADVGSFVLWADGRPLVVDPGAFAYEGEQRDRFRGTAAHATVTVDGTDQCDLWAPFRAAFLPRVTRSDVVRSGDALVLSVEHDGYRRLPDPVVHRRSFCWLPAAGLVVVDVIRATRSHRVRTVLPLSPGLRPVNGRVGELVVAPLGDGGPAQEEPARYSPYLGTAVDSVALVREHEVGPGQAFGWSLLRQPARVASADAARIVVETSGGSVELELPEATLRTR